MKVPDSPEEEVKSITKMLVIAVDVLVKKISSFDPESAEEVRTGFALLLKKIPFSEESAQEVAE